jgi:uncharacterized protein (DUF427 family)
LHFNLKGNFLKEEIMTKSPGHQKWPDHKVAEEHPQKHYKATLNGKVIAESDRVIKVVEDNHPERYYFPREDVKTELLESTPTTTECPFKGTAHYFSIKDEQGKINDAVWSYEDPYEEHSDLKNYLAFYDDKIDKLNVSAA